MDARLDPGCAGARAIEKRQREQDALLVAQSEGQLAQVVRQQQEKDVRDHLVRCARCRHRDPACAACGHDPRRERHGWMCPNAPHRWRDLLPWNWRPRRAPPRAPRGWSDVGVDVVARAARTPHAAAPQAAPAAPSPARPARAPPKPRAKPTRPQPSALALAYAALGLAPDATEQAVRAAYRQRAQQYHPDKVGHLAPEFRAVAEQKMTEINAAYERIKRTWG